jgi:hypothetical protein
MTPRSMFASCAVPARQEAIARDRASWAKSTRSVNATTKPGVRSRVDSAMHEEPGGGHRRWWWKASCTSESTDQ